MSPFLKGKTLSSPLEVEVGYRPIRRLEVGRRAPGGDDPSFGYLGSLRPHRKPGDAGPGPDRLPDERYPRLCAYSTPWESRGPRRIGRKLMNDTAKDTGIILPALRAIVDRYEAENIKGLEDHPHSGRPSKSRWPM